MSESDMNYMERQERAVRKKFLWIAVPVWVVLVVLSGWIYLRQGIYVDGDFLYRSGADCYRRQQDEIRMYEEGAATRFEVTWDGRKHTAVLKWGEPAGNNGTQVCVTFQDGSVVEGIWNGDTLSDADGRDLSFGSVEIVTTVNGKRPSVSDATWSSIFCRLSLGDTETKGSWLFLFIGTVAYVLGALGFLFPDNVHFFLRRWQYEKAALSDAGRFVAKIGGIVAMILGGIMMLHCFIS